MCWKDHGTQKLEVEHKVGRLVVMYNSKAGTSNL